MGRTEAASQEAKSLKQPLTELSKHAEHETWAAAPGRAPTPRLRARLGDRSQPEAEGEGTERPGAQAPRRLPTVYTKKPNRNLNADGCRLGAQGASAPGCAGPRVWLQVGGEHRA